MAKEPARMHATGDDQALAVLFQFVQQGVSLGISPVRRQMSDSAALGWCKHCFFAFWPLAFEGKRRYLRAWLSMGSRWTRSLASRVNMGMQVNHRCSRAS